MHRAAAPLARSCTADRYLFTVLACTSAPCFMSPVLSDEAQALLGRVEVHPDEAFSARYPHEPGARVTVWTRGGKNLERERCGFEGGLGKPLSWERKVEKINWLSKRDSSRPGPTAQTDAEIVRAVGDISTVIFLPIGTAAMGQGRRAVVDHQLRVHGVDGLHVANAPRSRRRSRPATPTRRP